MRDDQVSTTDVSEPQLQILGVLKCLIDILLPENITSHNRISIPIYLEAIATITSLLQPSIIDQRAFLNILWYASLPNIYQLIKSRLNTSCRWLFRQRLCPMLMWFLGNQKEEKNLTSTTALQHHDGGSDRITQGTAVSVAAPDLWPEALKCIYE